MNAVKSINKLLTGIDKTLKNKTGPIFLNAVKNELIKINSEIQIPKIPVKEFSYDTASGTINNIKNYIPEFLLGHTLLENRKPASEQHSLHFVMQIKGLLIDFIHILKIDFKFGGDSDNIIEKGDSGNYPSYKTDRLYYKSRLIPVTSVKKNQFIEDFSPAKLFDKTYIESDKRFFTAIIFDDIDNSEKYEDIKSKINLDIFGISQELYPFIVYDYNTACMNILYPVKSEIEKSVNLFEPVFIALYSKYKNINELGNGINILEIFNDSLKGKNTLSLKKYHIDNLREYFKKFSIYRNNELMLKAWWRIDINA